MVKKPRMVEASVNSRKSVAKAMPVIDRNCPATVMVTSLRLETRSPSGRSRAARAEPRRRVPREGPHEALIGRAAVPRGAAGGLAVTAAVAMDAENTTINRENMRAYQGLQQEGMTDEETRGALLLQAVRWSGSGSPRLERNSTKHRNPMEIDVEKCWNPS